MIKNFFCANLLKWKAGQVGPFLKAVNILCQFFGSNPNIGFFKPSEEWRVFGGGLSAFLVLNQFSQYYSLGVSPSILLLLWLHVSNATAQAEEYLGFDTIDFDLLDVSKDRFWLLVTLQLKLTPTIRQVSEYEFPRIVSSCLSKTMTKFQSLTKVCLAAVWVKPNVFLPPFTFQCKLFCLNSISVFILDPFQFRWNEVKNIFPDNLCMEVIN